MEARELLREGGPANDVRPAIEKLREPLFVVVEDCDEVEDRVDPSEMLTPPGVDPADPPSREYDLEDVKRLALKYGFDVVGPPLE